MALKRVFNNDEKIGLSIREVEIGEKYLRKNKTAAVQCHFSPCHSMFTVARC